MGMLLSRYHNNDSFNSGAAKAVAPKPSEPVKEVVEEKAKKANLEYTAEDIQKMNGNKLRKLAKENGIDNPEELTVGELKAVLSEKFG